MNYKGKSLPWLKRKCQFYFNQYIRLRDKGKPCISCGKPDTQHASHFYSVRMNDAMRFDEENVHAACALCNTFLYGNLYYYGLRLPRRIGDKEFKMLVNRAEKSKQTTHKWDRWELIEKIEHYKALCKSLSGQ